MLNHFIQPVSYSSGQPVEGIQPVQAYTPYNQLSKLVPAFSLPDDGTKSDDEKKKKGSVKEENGEKSEILLPESFRIILNRDFSELIDLFLISDHEFILQLRKSIRDSRGIDRLTIISPAGRNPEKFDMLREHLYEVQVQLFKTPSGVHCHIIA